LNRQCRATLPTQLGVENGGMGIVVVALCVWGLVVPIIAGAADTAPAAVQAPIPASADPALANAEQLKGKTITTALYSVRDGNKVDAKTLMGWKTWRALACERCHGASQEGLVGPPLVISLKALTKEQFRTTIIDGRLPKGMPPFSASQMVQANWEGLYAYLKGRSDGNILPGHLYPMDSTQPRPNGS
jgi:mono/diheme cytochrome c family protein